MSENDRRSAPCPKCGKEIPCQPIHAETTLREFRCGHCDEPLVMAEMVSREVRIAGPCHIKVDDMCMAGSISPAVKMAPCGPVRVETLSITWNNTWWATYVRPEDGDFWGSQPADRLTKIEGED